MGVNATGGSPSSTMQQLSPQQAAQLQQLQALRQMALTPYQGNAAGGGTAQGIAQLAAALLARRRQQALLTGNPGAALQPLPIVSATPGGATNGAPPDPAGLNAPG